MKRTGSGRGTDLGERHTLLRCTSKHTFKTHLQSLSIPLSFSLYASILLSITSNLSISLYPSVYMPLSFILFILLIRLGMPDDPKLNSCVEVTEDLKFVGPCTCGNGCDMLKITVLDPGAMMRSRISKDTSNVHSTKSRLIGKSLNIKVLEYADASAEKAYKALIERDATDGWTPSINSDNSGKDNAGEGGGSEADAKAAETVNKAASWKHSHAVLHDNGAKVLATSLSFSPPLFPAKPRQHAPPSLAEQQ